MNGRRMEGNVLAFIERPLSGAFIALSVIFFLLPLLKYLRRGDARQVTPAE